ncbi:MAG: CobW family GTP-binding protein [Candidatus Limivicinus sp.]|nr:CobW family GTP-binding protein [Candidatus Limivicinus sp.]
MTRIDIFSGFLGAGKTTLIRKLINEGYRDRKLVLIENEFGEIAIDGGFLKDAGVEITEMNSGCICCTLVGDFTKALKKVMDDYAPDCILIEPSGVGKLSDVTRAVECVEGAHIGAKVTVVDAGKCRMYMRNFGEFFNDQVENADLIVMSRTDTVPEAKVQAAAGMLRGLNPNAGLITTQLDRISGAQILEAMDKNGLKAQMEELEHEHHEHHHHDEDGECACGCHEHDHEHHHHHHADEIFTSWGTETPHKFTETGLRRILEALDENAVYGTILRAKGIVDASDGDWLYFDYTPGEYDVRRGSAAVTGRFCVIGSKLNEKALKELFEVE